MNTQRAALACVVAMTVASGALAQGSSAALDNYLRSVGLSGAQIADAKLGRLVTAALRTDNPRDISVFGIIGIPVSQATYQPRMRDMGHALAGRTPAYGIISDPVADGNLATIAIDESEYKEVRKCKPNACSFKLPAAAMQGFSDGVNWGGPDPKRQLDSLVREALKQFIARYREVGNAAMVRYDDRGAVQSSDVFAALLGQSEYLGQHAPALRDYLLSYPAKRPDGVTDELYWMMSEKSVLRPTLTLNHMIVYTPTDGAALVARKQIYANHYFEGGFELLAAIDAPSANDSPFMYLVNVRRYRYDNFPGGVVFNAKGRVRDGLIAAVRADLEHERAAFVPAGSARP